MKNTLETLMRLNCWSKNLVKLLRHLLLKMQLTLVSLTAIA